MKGKRSEYNREMKEKRVVDTLESTTHKELKELAAHWLKGKVTDLVSNEVKLFVKRKKLVADAVGINLKKKEVRFIEVKVSKADLRRDALLSDERFSYAKIGHYAYIMSPVGVLDPEDIPPGYGHLEVHEGGAVHVVKKPQKNSTCALRYDTVLKRSIRALTNAYLYKQIGS
jgi:hypothetical protein